MARCCCQEAPPPSEKPPALSVETLCQTLRDNGLRITEGRRTILRVLFAARQPLTLQELQTASLRHTSKAPDYATVFRLLTLLEELGHVHKVNLHKSCSYYELHRPGQHYDHLVCEICGKVILLDLPCPVRETETWIREKFGFTGLHHSLEFFGQCPECTTARPPS